MIQRRIDLNADLGEGFGPYTIGDDLALLDIVTSANVACGFHAGSPDVMFATFKAARERGVAVGAHPGFADRAHFGRRVLPHSAAEIERLVAYQVGAACGMAALAGHRLTYVKAHGALYNLAAIDEPTARAVARGIKAVDRSLVCLVLSASIAARVTDSEGLAVASEIFADRGYRPDGTLIPRDAPGAVFHDAEVITERVLAMLERGAIIAMDGTERIAEMDSICVHGDTPGAVQIARELRTALATAGHRVSSFAPAAG